MADESFQAWQDLFFISLEIGTEYYELLPLITKWLKEISQKSEISMPLTKQDIPFFINSTVPKLLERLLEANILSLIGVKAVGDFLINIVHFFGLGLICPTISLIEAYSKLFIRSSKLYDSHPSIYEQVMDAFKQIYNEHDFSLDLIKANKPGKKKFCYYFFFWTSIFTNLIKEKIPDINYQEILHDLLKLFPEFLQQTIKKAPTFFENQQQFIVIKKCFESLMVFDKYIKIRDEEIIKLFQQLYDFLKTQKHPQILEFLVHCISQLFKNTKNLRIIEKHYEHSKPIIPFLLSLKLPPRAIYELKSFILQSQINDLPTLIEIWTICSNSPVQSDHPILIDICATLLTSFQSDSIQLFLSLIQQNLTPFYYFFLAKLVVKLSTINNDIATSSAVLLFNLSLVDESAKEALFDLISHNSNFAVSDVLFQKALELLEGEHSKMGSQILIALIDEWRLSPNLKTDSYIDMIQNKKNEENESEINEILLPFYLKLGTFPSSSFIDAFLQERSDATWSFFKQLFKQSSSQFKSDLDPIRKAALSEDPANVNLTFLSFFKYLIFKYNQGCFVNPETNAPISTLKVPYTIKNAKDISGLDFLLDIVLLNTDPLVQEKAKLFLLTVLKNWSNQNSVCFLMNQFKEFLKSFDAGFYIHFLDLILQYIKESEINSDPEDFDYPRHIYPYGYYTVSYKLNGEEKSFHINPQNTMLQIKERIGQREKCPPNSVQIRKSDKALDLIPIRNCGFPKNMTLEITVNSTKEYSVAKPPSFYFHKLKLADKLLESLDKTTSNSYDSQVYELLKLLPTSEGILSIFEAASSDIDIAISTIHQTENPYLLIYYIQASAQKNLNLVFIDAIQSLIDKFLTTEHFKEILIHIIDSVYTNEIFDGCANLSILLIQNLFSYHDQDLIDIIVKLIHRFSEKNDIFSLEVLSYLVDGIPNLDKCNWESLIGIIKNMSKNHHRDVLKFTLNRLYSQISSFLLQVLARLITENDFALIYQFTNYLLESIQHDLDSTFLPDALQCLCQIIKIFRAKIDQFDLPIDLFLSLAFGSRYTTVQKPIFGILKTFINNSTGLAHISTAIQEFIQFPLEKWGYNPSLFNRQSFTGIRNLGATCFMNAVFQQMYHLFPVRYLISTYKFDEKNELRTLQEIMIKMKFTLRPYVDTTTFIETYHCWQSELLNPKEQQDACEFFTSLMDSLPNEITNMFKGTMVNFISGLDIPFEKTKQETFYTLSVSIKGHNNINSSFQDMIQEEQLTDYELDNQKTKISAKKYTKISELPKVLVIQLTRFEYSAITYERIKINDKYEFPLELNLKDLCKNPIDETSFDYDLSGIILHSGSANGGHYFSYIRNNNEWWSLNDVEITQVKEQDVLTNSFGGKENCLSAYVLFYTKRDYQSICNHGQKLTFNNEFDYSNEIIGLEEIKKDNNIYQKTQALFGPDLIDFIESIDDPLLNLSFYIRVLCRSRNEDKAYSFMTNLISIIKQSHESDLFIYATYLYSHFQDVFNNFLNCSAAIFISCLNSIVSCVFNYLGSSEKACNIGFAFYELFVEQIIVHKQSYRQIPMMLDFVEGYISKHAKVALERQWFDILMNLLDSFYDPSLLKNQIYISNINLSSLFKMLICLLEVNSNSKLLDTYDLFKYSSYIKENEKHLSLYKNLIEMSIDKYFVQVPINEKQFLKIDDKRNQDQIINQLVKIITTDDPKDIPEEFNEDNDPQTNNLDEMKIQYLNSKIESLVNTNKVRESDIIENIKGLISKNPTLAYEMVKLTPQLFINRIMNNKAITSYQELYVSLLNTTQSPMIISRMVDYLNDIIFDSNKLVEFIPEIPENNIVEVPRITEFKLPCFIKLISCLLQKQSAYYTPERAEQFISMAEKIDKARRYSIDFHFVNLIELIASFPLNALKGKLQRCLNLYIRRSNEIDGSLQLREFQPFEQLIRTFFPQKVPNPNDSYTQELIQLLENDAFFSQYQVILITYLSDSRKDLHSSYNPSVIFQFYLILSQTNENIREKVLSLLASICKDLNILLSKITPIIDLINTHNKSLLVPELIMYFLNRLIADNDETQSLTSFPKFIQLINQIDLPINFDSIVYHSKFAEKVSTLAPNLYTMTLEWFYSHSPEVASKLVTDLIGLIRSKPFQAEIPRKFLTQVLIRQHDLNHLILLVKSVNTSVANSIYQILYSSLSPKKNEDLNWFVPFIFEYFIQSDENIELTEKQLVTLIVSRISQDNKLEILIQMEDKFKSADSRNLKCVVARFIAYININKDVFNEYKKITTLNREIIKAKELDSSQLSLVLFGEK